MCFTGLVISPPATGLALTATSADLGSATSAAFDVLSGELAELRPTGAPATVTAGDSLSVTLTAYDAYDNVLTTYDGAISFSSRGQSGFNKENLFSSPGFRAVQGLLKTFRP